MLEAAWRSLAATFVVIPWLDHGIHSVTPMMSGDRYGMDARIKSGHDDVEVVSTVE
jgi:hypothetical protein